MVRERLQSLITKPTDGPISRYLNRRISSRITQAIVKYNVPLTPNQVSLIAFALAVTASAMYFMGNSILAGILVQLSSIIDGVDGELARVRGLVSKRGGFLDTMLDRYADIFIVVAIVHSVLSHNPGALYLVLGLLALSGDLLVSYLHARSQFDLGIHASHVGPLDSIASRDVRLFIIFIGSILCALSYVIFILAILTHIYVVVKTVALLQYGKCT